MRTIDLLHNNLSTAISQFWLRLCRSSLLYIQSYTALSSLRASLKIEKFRYENYYVKGLISFLVLITLIFNFFNVEVIKAAESGSAELGPETAFNGKDPNLLFLADNSLIALPNVNLTAPEEKVNYRKTIIIVTAYSSTPEQTDASPFITASGKYVRDGIVAVNFLKFGTKVKFPRLFGDKAFVVEDRLHPKNGHKADIWFASRTAALNFGVKRTEMLILAP